MPKTNISSGSEIPGPSNSVPTIRLDHLSQEQLQAYVLADNKIAENAGWDREILAIELQHLLAIESDLDITITGFEIPEIDLILEGAGQNANQEDELPSQDGGGPVTTESGDLWLLGKRRLLCGSALRSEAFIKLMEQRRTILFEQLQRPVSGSGTFPQLKSNVLRNPTGV